MSDPCPTCDEQTPTGPAHALLIPKVNPDIGSPAPKPLGPCDDSEPSNPALCNDGYRIPIITAQSVAPDICSDWDVRTPCADRWAYPGLLVEIYPLGHAVVKIAKGDVVTMQNMTLEPDSIVAQGLTMRPIPRTPVALEGIPDSDVQDPANYQAGALSQNVRFLVAEYLERCGTFWKLTARKGMCGLPLETAVGMSGYNMVIWNPATGCFGFLPNGDDADALVMRNGKPVWFSATETKAIFAYTGSQQQITVPDWAIRCEIKCWGAGGSWDGGINGGCGGFTRVVMPVGTAASAEVIKQTAILSIIVGQGQHDITTVFGFGGTGQGGAHQHNGGGLAGVFTGPEPVLKTDFGRAIVIAGGGGAGGQSGGGSPRNYGGNGNTVTGATMPDMQGAAATGSSATSGSGGGGGGFRGGQGAYLNAYGGSGFAHAAATEQELLFLGNVVAIDPPKITDPDYVSGVGRQGQPGRVVIQFFET